MKDLSQTIKDMPIEQVRDLVRDRLQFDNHEIGQLRIMQEGYLPHKRFDMSGYGDGCGSCVVHNMNILNLFRDLGIYNHVNYLFVDAYKGVITLHYQLWNNDEHVANDYGKELRNDVRVLEPHECE